LVDATARRDAQFSPDGKWVAYVSEESGRSEVYVRPFPGPGQKLLVSTEGGAQPRWRGDGRELFYIGLDERLMAVPVNPQGDNSVLGAGAPIPLFTTSVGGAVQDSTTALYMVSRDNEHFLVSKLVEEGSTSPITLILNWKAKLLPR
jgi:hypothetical protein